MEFDIKTLILILGITHLIQVVVFSYQYRANKQLNGPGWWLLWSATELLGFVFMLLRNIPSALPSIILFQNIIMLSGQVFIYIGIKRFFNSKINYKFLSVLFITFLLFHFYFILVNNAIIPRSVNISFFLALISFITAYAVYKNKNKATALTANFITIIFLLHGCVFTLRSALLLGNADGYDVFSPTLVNLLPYLDALIVALLWTFGFIMMINQQLNFDIREAKTHFELIFKSSPDAVIITRLKDGYIADCNDGFARMTGYSKAELIGQTTLSLALWNEIHDREILIKNLKDKGEFENFEFLFRTRAGETRTALISARVLNINGEPHQLGVIRDITERKLVEEEIRTKNEQLNQLNIEKDKFFSIIAHDLRSPFGSFLGLTELLTEQLYLLPKERLEALVKKLKESAVNLYQLLENLLEWSRMEQGAIPFNPVRLNVKGVMDENIEMMSEVAKAKAVIIYSNIPDDLNVVADWHMTQSIIRNLLSNAIKFSHRGSFVEIAARKDSTGQVEVRIRDTGIGMSMPIQSNLFNIAIRSNRKGTEGEASSGLGLILSKSFVEKHGGTIGVESEEGKGSTFYFTLPANLSEENSGRG